uniref:Ubiquitin carboxyl-terminal hydrolase n=1 Tax=Strongyloides stercoralis TaxID=6248 RepID=A0A0K0EBQ3_STRER
MARKINGISSVKKTSCIPTQDELKKSFDTCLSPEVKNKCLNQSSGKLIPLLSKFLIDSKASYNSGDYMTAQTYAARISIITREILSRNRAEEGTVDSFKKLLSGSVEILENLKNLSIEYHTSNGTFDDSSEKSIEGDGDFSIKNTISPIEFLDLVKKDKKILLVDYHEDSNSFISIPQYSNLEVFYLCPLVLTKYLSYKELCNKFPTIYQEKLKKSYYDFIILVGDKSEDDNEKDIREEILIKGFTTIKNISFNECSSPVLPLEGGFQEFFLCYPHYVKKGEKLVSMFTCHQQFLKFLESHRNQSISNIQEYPQIGKSTTSQVKVDEDKKIDFLEETKENNLSLTKDMSQGDVTVPKATKPISRHQPMSKPVPQPRRHNEKLDKKDVPNLTTKMVNNVCDSLNKLNGVAEKPTVPDKSTKPQPTGIQIPHRELKENVIKKRKIFDDRIIEIYSYCLKDLQMRSMEGPTSLGMTGLINLGNTCFMNSVLQALFHIPEMRELFTIKNIIKYINENNKLGTQGSITAVFTSLMDLFWTGQYRKIHPESFLVTFANQVNGRLIDRCQQDAQEFQIYLLDALHEDTNYISTRKSFSQNYDGTNLFEDFNDYKKKTEQFSYSKVNSLFNLRTVSTVVCSVCDYQSVTFEDSVQISVELPIQMQSTRLSECLSNHFSVEILNDGWRCPKCDVIRKSTKTQRIWELPEILVIHKKRFAYVSGCCDKNNVFVDFDINDFNVSSFVHEKNVENVRALYDLYAVVNHMGSLNSGHYTSYVRSGSQWFECDDDNVKNVVDKDHEIKTKTAFMLYYRLKK